MSPISTAHLNPDAFTFCLSPPAHSVLVPILVNNTTPANIRYSFTPLTYVEGQSGTGRIEHIELSGKDFKAIEQARLEGLQSVRVHSADDEYDDDDDDETQSTSDAQLQKTQSLTHLRVTKPGTIRLERILDSSGVAARLAHPLEVTVVPCPTAYYTDDSVAQPADAVRCQGDASGVDLTIDIRGVPPLSLRWSKYVDGKKESFLVEGIEDSDPASHSHADSRNVVRTKIPQMLKVPLSLPAEPLGRVTIVLESVIDGMGNIVPLDEGITGETLHREAPLNPKTVRSLNILRRPSVSFRNCGPGNPVSLLIGSDAPLFLQVTDSDPLDAPWTVAVKFDPSEDGKGGSKSVKPWKDTLHTHQSSLSLSASAAGEYTILGIRGKVRT